MASSRAQAIKHLTDLQHIQLNGIRFRLIDAKGMVVGRLAMEIARILQGKDKPTYNPKHNMGDVVVVINAAHVHFTNDQWQTKLYRWHTGYPGGLRERVASHQWDRDPTSILRIAVKGMLPKNRMRVYRLDKLKIFPEAEHPYAGLHLVPYVPRPRPLHLPGLGWPLPPGMQPMNQEKYAFRALASPWLRTAGAGSTPVEAGQQQQQHEQRQQQEQQELQQQQQQASIQQGSGGQTPQQQQRPRKGPAMVRSAQLQDSGGLGLAGLEALLTPEEKAAWQASLGQQGPGESRPQEGQSGKQGPAAKSGRQKGKQAPAKSSPQDGQSGEQAPAKSSGESEEQGPAKNSRRRGKAGPWQEQPPGQAE